MWYLYRDLEQPKFNSYFQLLRTFLSDHTACLIWDVLTAMIHVVFFWVLTLGNVGGSLLTFRKIVLPSSSGWSEVGSSMVLHSVGVLPRQYTALKPRRLRHGRVSNIAGFQQVWNCSLRSWHDGNSFIRMNRIKEQELRGHIFLSFRKFVAWLVDLPAEFLWLGLSVTSQFGLMKSLCYVSYCITAERKWRL
jgi:hypothetical protein